MRDASVAMDAPRRRFVEAIGALVLLPGARRARGAAPAAAAAARAPAHAVSIDAFEFKPATLTVRRGERVTWTNTDPVPHTVTAQGRFDSGAIASGAAWALTLRDVGRYDYVCAYHPTMRGTLVVE